MTAVFPEFLRFGVVGVIGFGVDTATVYALRSALGLIGAGLVAYLVAATMNWALNRAWTFRDRRHARLYRQWAAYLLTNSAGFVLNRGTYTLLVAGSPLCRGYPVLAVAAGSIAGMFVNFALSRRLVFR
ncbi:MAG: GtrA family protein [Acidisphaera sp.]|nr:GtrA family protein [Acidisphaera sp.]